MKTENEEIIRKVVIIFINHNENIKCSVYNDGRDREKEPWKILCV